MIAKSLKWALAGLVVCPAAALALGLGDIHLNSALDAPLDADIELIGATPDELATLKPQIASRETFARNGLDWPSFLATVTLRAVHTADGRDIIKLHTSDPITEPFITMLVEVDWDRGKVVREYTLLLDPPVYQTNRNQVANAPVAAPATGATREGAIERAPGQTAQTAPAATGAATAASAAAGAAAATAAPSESTPGSESATSSASNSSTASSAASSGAASAAEGASPSAGAESSKRPSSVSTAATSAEDYTIQQGDTLSRIAKRYAGPTVSDERRWMLAAYEANPAAFHRNMNAMHSGAVLRIPDQASVDAITVQQANTEVRRQFAAWRESTGRVASTTQEPGRLRLVAPTESPSADAGAGPAPGKGPSADVKALQGRVQELQSQLDESHRLLEMRNAELAELQSKLAARGGAAAPGAAPAANAPNAAANPPTAPEAQPQPSVPPPVAKVEQPPQAVPAPAPEATQPANPPLASAPVPASPPPVVRRPLPHPAAQHARAESSSWLDSLLGLWWVFALLIVAALAFFGLRTLAARRRTGFDDSLGRLAEAGAEALSAREPTFESTNPQLMPQRDSNFLVEESGTHERPRFDGGSPAAPPTRHVASDETISSETAINLDQGDPLAEADFHMAYGLYDQAADLVRIAIQREPERRDLKLKLLEVFFVWGNKEQFLQTSRELAETRAQAAPGEWEKVVIMGKQLAPEDPLFAGGAGVSGAAAGGVDLDLEGGQSRVDFDILGDPITPAAGVDLDIGTAIGEREALEAAAGQATDKNPRVRQGGGREEDTVEREAATGTTRQMTAKLPRDASGATQQMTAKLPRDMGGTTQQMTAKLPRDMSGATQQMTVKTPRGAPSPSTDDTQEGPTIEQPRPDAQNPALRQKVEMALKQGGGEHTTEVALDDLGLDLASLDAGAVDTAENPALAATPDSPTMVAGLDERSRRMMETAEQRAAGAGSLSQSESGSWQLDGAIEEANADTANTSRLAALKSAGLDFDLGEAQAPAASPNGAGGPVDLDVGTATVPDAGFVATQRLGSEDLALPDLDPVTMSEVGTKLDLARAYMDMGDPEGARNILEEVLSEGSVAQKQEAERLIASLPG